MYTVVAYQVASTINIKACKQKFPLKLLFHDSDELYYSSSSEHFIYIFHYGMVSFFNMSENEIEGVLKQIKPFCNDYHSEKISEETIPSCL